ncbi:inositol monophosphatase family protein [Demequina aurantiaca]|uniref:inositol monophosphatase family protein n=1 Tax=Demequina aurantiaca TaxID=676200 RepID=UPI003D32EB67
MIPTGEYAADLNLALAMADEVDALTMRNSDPADLTVELKPDDTPVTAVDRAAEQLIRSALQQQRPADSLLGEEYGSSGDSARRWIVDPIDGTKNFIRGVPVWATLIALFDGDKPAVGVVSAPALGRRWFAAAGDGAWEGQDAATARRLAVSQVASLPEASMSYSSLTGWEPIGRLDSLLDLSREVWRTRAYGDFWSYMLVAEGAVDIAAEPELEVYDMAALVPIVLEAGGRFTSLDGIEGPFGGNAIASNGALHDAAVAALAARS